MILDGLQIEYRPIEFLEPYSNNARTHSKKQVAQIAASLREFGFVNPILVDDRNGIVAGHGRVLAARSLGMERVPVIELAHLSEAQRRAYVIADNKLAMNAGWDEDLLRLEVGFLVDEAFDLDLLGFSDIEIGSLLPASDPLSGDDVEQSEALTRKWRPARGALWQAGRHRIMCGDSLIASDVARLTDGQELDLVLTDPPYELDASLVRQAMGLLAPRAVVLTAQKQAFGLPGQDWQFCFDQVWIRSPKGLMTPYAPQYRHTNILHLVRSGFKLGWKKAHKSHNTVIEVDGPDHVRGGAYGKNPAVFVEMLRGYKWLRCGDPFCGTGCSVLACEHTDRTCYAMERDVDQCAVALERAALAGLAPTLLAPPPDGQNGK